MDDGGWWWMVDNNGQKNVAGCRHREMRWD